MKENNYIKVSPFTGGKVELVDDESTVTFRGEKITAPRQFYRCVDTGREFTDDKVDDDFIWAVFREYCSRKYPTLTEILEREIPDLIEKKLNVVESPAHPLEPFKSWYENVQSAKNADNKPHDTPIDIEDAHPIDIPDIPVCVFSAEKPDKNGRVYKQEAFMDAFNKWKERLKKEGYDFKGKN